MLPAHACLQHQVGFLTLDLMHLEVRRAQHWQQRQQQQQSDGDGVAAVPRGSAVLRREVAAGGGGGGGEARLAEALARQEAPGGGLYVGLSLLLCLAERDAEVEPKMVKKVRRGDRQVRGRKRRVGGGRASAVCEGWPKM